MNTEQESKIKQNKFYFILIFIVFIIVIFEIYMYTINPIKQLQRYIDNKDYTNAIIVYNDKIQGSSNENIFNSDFLEYIEYIVDLWATNELDYKKASAFLEVIEEINNVDIAQKATINKELILFEGQNQELYLKAETYYSSKDYISAMNIIEDINPKYSQRDSAQNLYNICKEIILENISNPTTVEDFEKNITLLEEYIALVNETDFLDMKLALENELVIFKDISSIIENAEVLYNKGEFKESFSVIEEGIIKYSDREELIESNRILHEMYVVSITQQIKTACVEEDYKTAVSIINTALEEYNCEEFRLLKENIKEQKSWIYRTYKDIKEKFNSLTVNWKNEKIDVKQMANDTGTYILKSGEKILLGDYSDEDITVLSIGGSIFSSIIAFDIVFDIRDLAYDIQHIGEQEYFIARLATDVIALLPVVGVVKYLKYTDDVADGIKTASNIIEQVTDTGKTTEKIVDVLKTSKTADNIAEAVDNASNANKTIDTVTDTTKDVKYYKHKTTIYEQFKGEEIAGVKYDSKKLDYSNGEFFEGVFPIFNSKFDFKLDVKYFKSTATIHKKNANEALYEKIKNDKHFAKQFTEKQIEQIQNGELPKEFVWHHSEEEGLLQLVDRKTHEKAKHTGGMSLWGKGYE